ncbi:HPP family protein [Polaromonas sp.]|uniref:HPP family protein n=1 Tax=Polaromonas sp. TaxID=1869339 RepID=UPI0024887AAD|nr:HPP family protein [Polaromonas sp.]MDI1274496.1 HPP family protein [Polaromonas sp.]
MIPPSRPEPGHLRASSPRIFSRIWWLAFLPARTGIDLRERMRLVVGALLGMLLTGLACHLAGAGMPPGLPWLVAPLGASAVLIFAVPASPMAQPWPVIGGNTVSALVGIAGVHGMHLLGAPELAAALAVATAIAVMLALRCLHPPGGATALMMVLGGISDPLFPLFPIMLNSALLVLAGIAFNNATRRPYPHMQVSPPGGAISREERQLDADLDAVIGHYNQVLDVSRDDLRTLLAQAQMRAYDRKLAEIRCADIMSRELVTVESGTPLQQAWALLRDRRIKALPVVDKSFRIAGIITLADFLRAAELDVYDGFDEKLRKLVRLTRSAYAAKPEVVGQIMTRNVRVAAMERHLIDLLPLFASTGHHHIPIIGNGEQLVGMITQSDLVAALGRAADPTA